jgi:hypothetical protein
MVGLMRNNGSYRGAVELQNQIEAWKRGEEGYEDCPAPDAVRTIVAPPVPKRRAKRPAKPAPAALPAPSSSDVASSSNYDSHVSWGDEPTVEGALYRKFNNGLRFADEEEEKPKDEIATVYKVIEAIKKQQCVPNKDPCDLECSKQLESVLVRCPQFDALDYVSQVQVTFRKGDQSLATTAFMAGHVQINGDWYLIGPRHYREAGRKYGDLHAIMLQASSVEIVRSFNCPQQGRLVRACITRDLCKPDFFLFDLSNAPGPHDAIYWKWDSPLMALPRGEPKAGDSFVYVTPAGGFGSKLIVRGGNIHKVSADGQVLVNASTRNGDCRTPYFCNGRVVAYHRYGSLVSDRVIYNGGDAAWAPRPAQKGHIVPFDVSLIRPAIELQGPTYKLPQLGHQAVFGNPNVRLYNLRDPCKFAFVPKHHVYFKPSSAMLADEVNKFAEVAEVLTDECVIEEAKEYVIRQDRKRCRAFSCSIEDWSLDDVCAAIDMLDLTSSAGHGYPGTTCHYITNLGEGDFEAGKRIVAERARQYAVDIEQGNYEEGDWMWRVFGKTDKYPLKKLTPILAGGEAAVRSIQAPNLYFKLLHLVYFGEGDQKWNRCPEYAVGESFDAPMPSLQRGRLEQTAVCDGTDATGWDRYVPAPLMQWYFREYLRILNPGVPLKVLEFFEQNTVNSLLVMPDGAVLRKSQGNPSGYPATLRLNSVLNKLATTIVELGYAKSIGKELTCAELESSSVHYYCGDDMVRFLDASVAYLSDAGYFKHAAAVFPKWRLKLEGRAVRSDFSSAEAWWMACPPFISRSWVPMHGRLWRPHGNLIRILAKYMYADAEETLDEAASKLLGVTDAMMHAIVWNADGVLHCPLVERFVAVTGFDPAPLVERYLALMDEAEVTDLLRGALQRTREEILGGCDGG